MVTTVSNTVIKYLIFAKRVGLQCSYQKKSKKEGRKEERRKERREREEESHNFHQVTGFDLIGYIPLWK